VAGTVDEACKGNMIWIKGPCKGNGWQIEGYKSCLLKCIQDFQQLK